MPDTETPMEVDRGTFVPTSVIYNTLLTVINRITIVETTLSAGKADTDRIRTMQTQLAALAVIQTLQIAFIIAQYINR